MELFSVTLAGFRRFSQKTMLRTNGKVLALVGPNEAGKSSILDAIASLGNSDALALEDVARGMDEEAVEIVGNFLLDEDDLEAARLTGPRWMSVNKDRKGEQTYGFDPPVPERDIRHRQTTIDATLQLLEDADFQTTVGETADDLPDKLRKAIAKLSGAGPNLSKAMLAELRETSGELISYRDEFEQVASTVAVTDLWTELVTLEEASSPERHAIDTLWRRVPDILLFDEEARELASSYSVGALRGAVPRALASLLELAGMNTGQLIDAIDSGSSARLTTLEHRANVALKGSFGEAWRQSGIRVALRLSAASVDVQIRNENADFTSLAERSDGLRQFVALFAFVSTNRSERPILLIDEAEQRLHYDAQADLVQMLTNQRVASKVIYTTHSAGCLPEDLGHGVRLVHPQGADATTSVITNKFWAIQGGGFSPLLFGLGATTMAFFPTRHALCVEGPADMLLLPQLIREALGTQTLGYQIVPNLSSAARELAPLVPAEASAIAFLVDGDPGGRKIKAALLRSGVPDTRVIVLETPDGQGLELEDLVEPTILLRAVDALIDRHHPGSAKLGAEAMPGAMRMEWLEAGYQRVTSQKLPKVELAYELLDMLDSDPALRLLDPGRAALLADIAAGVTQAIRNRS
ncbi:AAA family ATPase [Sphingomonas melonis]|uniref:Putative ATPase n=1 Tax=Sphingomonas melonis TaxID=152682 RepID=A0A7Y9FKU3_9SPHN|nr:AAA family ATPase [Sphingomonas melonis]NYD89171.1 putative ATPase [Sphingomonas melonis]